MKRDRNLLSPLKAGHASFVRGLQFGVSSITTVFGPSIVTITMPPSDGLARDREAVRSDIRRAAEKIRREAKSADAAIEQKARIVASLADERAA